MADTPTQYHATLMIIRDHRMTAEARMPGDSPEAALEAIQKWIMSMYPSPLRDLPAPQFAEACAAALACIGIERDMDKPLSRSMLANGQMTALTVAHADKVDGVPAATAAIWINDASLTDSVNTLAVPALLRALLDENFAGKD
jgi:hypothetical protein